VTKIACRLAPFGQPDRFFTPLAKGKVRAAPRMIVGDCGIVSA
jgi:hypothetical protein